MQTQTYVPLPEVERDVCGALSEWFGCMRIPITLETRLIEDLRCDSLELVELLMTLEERFHVTILDRWDDPLAKAIFTRQPCRVGDLAEMVYLQQGSGKPREGGRSQNLTTFPQRWGPFTQLSGTWQPRSGDNAEPLYEALVPDAGLPQFRRRSDGMRCVLIPAAEVEIGSTATEALPDERPVHTVPLDAFVIDAEPVSTTAYCRFLNSIDCYQSDLARWFLLDEEDRRRAHLQIEHRGRQWQPVAGAERLPMVLVSWYGANAYSLWANAADWTGYQEAEGFLPAEAQWEYAARGHASRPFPCGDGADEDGAMACGRHRRGDQYTAATLPMSPVNEQLGVSPFGLHHMAGNVWQWCRDWYEEGFYARPEATERNPVNRLNSGVRSERGGSWVGPAPLCRSSYRRGRVPSAFGRCLGFRCTGPVEALPRQKRRR